LTSFEITSDSPDIPPITGAAAKTIGVLIHRVDDDLAAALVLGLMQKAAQHDLRLVFFPGRHLHSTQLFNRQFNVLFDLAYHLPLDGILSLTNSYQAGAYEDEISQVFSLFGSTPLLSMNFVAPGNPSVIVDNRAGAELLFRHLIGIHGYRRIAYMRGADGHFDEEERFAAYLSALQKAHIPFEPALVVQGNFERDGGRRAMEELLARQVPFEALVAANDTMALAALTVAQERNLHVPGDFAICGFDNLLSAQREAPMITTVHQPMTTQVQIALELLLSHMQGNSIPLVTKVPMRLVVRQSCGCIGERGGARQDSKAFPAEQGANYRERILADLGLPETRATVYKSYLLFLEHCLRQFEKSGWMDVAIGEFANECLATEGDISHLQALVFYLQRHLLDVCPSLRSAPSVGHILACAEQLQKWQLVIIDKLRAYQLSIRQREEHDAEILSRLVKTQLTDFSLAGICQLLETTLRQIGVTQCVMGLYPHSFDYQLFGVDIPRELRLMLVMVNGELDQSRPGQLIPLDVLLGETPCINRSLVQVVLPIFHQNRHYGLLLLDMTDNPRIPLEWLRHELSSILVGAIVAEELQQQQQHLQRHLDIRNHQNARLINIVERDELTGLLNRRGFFHRAPAWVNSHGGRDIRLVFIDLDDLKKINDTHGHSEGDLALGVAASLISTSFRADDLIARLSGDEFVVLTSGQQGEEDLRGRLYQQFDRYNQTSNLAYHLGCSLGCYSFRAEEMVSLEALVAKADQLLYEEKRRRKRGRTD